MDPAEHAKPAPPKPARAAAVSAWEKHVREMQERAKAVDWKKVNLASLNPKDIGVMLGPPMTQEEFDAYRRNAGKPVTKK